MKKIFLSIFMAASVLCTASAQNKIVIPDTQDYLVLTGDMHIHTIFSDGSVWPATRIKECLAEGVEVLCMTDHMDGRHQKMARQGLFNSDRNTSNELAAKATEEGVKEALKARRTAIFADGNVYGNEQLLTALVDACLKVTSVKQDAHKTGVTLENSSSISFRLKRIWDGATAAYSNFNIVYPLGSEYYECTGVNAYKTPVEEDVFELAFEIENFFVAPGKHLTYKISIKKP